MSKRKILQTKLFAKQRKKLKPNQKCDLQEAIEVIIKNPKLGTEKKGDLAGTWVYKFKMVKQLTLLAYEFTKSTLTLLSIGSHENFYRNLKKYLN